MKARTKLRSEYDYGPDSLGLILKASSVLEYCLRSVEIVVFRGSRDCKMGYCKMV